VAALQARGDALLRLGRPQRAADVLQRVLDQRPRREAALSKHALACEATGDDSAALQSWQRVVEVNPYLPFAREHLVALLARQRAWTELQPHTDAWLRLDPGSIEAHKAWILARIKTGQRAEADTAFARVRALHPFSGAALQAWYEDVQP
jgi:tetratricopeptide (TPR) repeat protein